MSDTFPSHHTISIGTDEVRKHLGEILNCVDLRGDEFTIKRKSKALAVLMPLHKHQLLTEMARQFALQTLSSERKTALQQDTEQLANKAKHSSRPVL